MKLENYGYYVLKELKQLLQSETFCTLIDNYELDAAYQYVIEHSHYDNICGGLTELLQTTLEIDPLDYLTTVPQTYTAYNKSVTEVILPPQIEEIGDFAFAECPNLVSVKINDGCKRIGKHAFQGCEKLTSIVLPSSLKRIECGAFLASGLTNIVIPDSVTYLGDDTFNFCTELRTAEMSSNISSILDHTFSWSEALEEIIVPPHLKEYVEELQLPENTKIIEKWP